KETAYTRVWESVKWSLSITCIMVVLVMLLRKAFFGLFTDHPDVIEIGAYVFFFSLLLETVRSINIVLVNSLRASVDAKYPLIIGACSMVLMSVPLGYFLVFHLDLGLVGILLAIAPDEWISSCIFFFRWP